MPIAPPNAARSVSVVPTATAPHKQRKYHRLYNLSRWNHPVNGLRARCLSKNPICADPHKIGCRAPANEVHHKIDHEGNEQLFWDFNNLQALCKQCHSGMAATKTEKRKPAYLDAQGRIVNQG